MGKYFNIDFINSCCIVYFGEREGERERVVLENLSLIKILIYIYSLVLLLI